MRIIVIAAAMLLGASSGVQADDPEAKTFMPPLASVAHKNASGGSVPAHAQAELPQFIPLRARHMGKPILQRVNAAPQNNEDIPTAHEGPPEAMTKEQAIQILSIYGRAE